MNLSVLIPWRTDNGARAKAWNYVRAMWEQLDVELIVAEDTGTDPLNVAACWNRAAAEATGDAFLVFGADQLPDAWHVEWAREQLTYNAWCGMYASTGHYSENDTKAILKGADPAAFGYEVTHPHCVGILGVHRDAWADSGGMDERFAGWGAEDTAFRFTLEHLYGQTPAPTGTLPSLWHPPAPRDHLDTNWAIVEELQRIEHDGGLRAHVNAKRDNTLS